PGSGRTTACLRGIRPLELYTSWRSIWGIRPPEIHTILRRSADLSSQISAWEDSLSDWTPLTVRSRLV
ncbi:unnamed protein product, partial [Larinioides sclopetarius]